MPVVSDIDPPDYMVASAFTVHDFDVAGYHNGAARTVTNTTAIAASDFTFEIGSVAGATLSPWVNRSISGPGIAPHTFVRSITAGGTVSLSKAFTDPVVASAGTFKIDNSQVRSTDAGMLVGGTSSLTTPPGSLSGSANFTASDVGKSVSGTRIPEGTVIASVTDADTATMSNPATGLGAFSSQLITIGETTIATSTRTMSDAVRTSASRVETVAGRNSPTFDVGLPVYGPGIAPGAVITSVNGAGNKNLNLGGACAPTCVTTVNVTAVTIVIGDPTGTAPVNGDLALSMGMQLDLSPTLVGGTQACSQGEAEGVVRAGTIYNPGSFQSPLLGGVIPSNVSVIGQIVFETATIADFAAYIVERPSLSAGDPILGRHYDVVFPSMPVSLAMCGATTAPATGYDSPGFGFSLTVLGQTAGQARIPFGTGRPGTAQVRSVRAATAGYLSTVHLQSDAGPAFVPAANFNRICVYPATNEVGFTCGNG